MQRHRAITVGLVLLAIVSVAGLPAVAQAVTASPITIGSIGVPVGQPPWVLTLNVDDSASTITSLAGSISGNGITPYPVTFALTLGSDSNGSWGVTIPPGAFAAGDYTVSVTAVDAASNTLTIANDGTVAYQYQPTLTATSSISTVTYQDQTVTFSGRLTAVPPGGGTPVGEAGINVFYAPAGGTPALLATTLADGTYSAVVPNVFGNSWLMTTDATSAMPATQSNEVTISQVTQPVQINNLDVTPSPAKYGQTLTLTGTVNYGFSTTSYVTDAPVQVEAGNITLPVATTNSSGQFSVKIPSIDGNMYQITAGEGNSLLQPTSVGVSFPVSQLPLRSKLFRAKLEGNGTVVASICLLTSLPNFDTGNPYNDVELEYSATKHGLWKKLGSLPNAPGYEGPAACQASGWSYYSDAVVPLAGRLISAYYRVYMPSNGTWAALYGAVTHSSLDRSRITSFHVSPRSVSNGGHFTIGGRLERKGKSWRGYAHQRVLILVRAKGQQDWNGLEYASTNGQGYFSHRNTASTGKGRLVFAALFLGNSAYLWSQSSQVTVTFNGGALHQLPASQGWLEGYLRGAQLLPRLTRQLPVPLS
jgi:hypothetical protein